MNIQHQFNTTMSYLLALAILAVGMMMIYFGARITGNVWVQYPVQALGFGLILIPAFRSWFKYLKNPDLKG